MDVLALVPEIIRALTDLLQGWLGMCLVLIQVSLSPSLSSTSLCFSSSHLNRHSVCVGDPWSASPTGPVGGWCHFPHSSSKVPPDSSCSELSLRHTLEPNYSGKRKGKDWLSQRSVWSRLWFFQSSCMAVRVGLWRKLSAEELMLLNCGVGKDSWESLGLQGDPTSPSWRRSVLGVHWKDWCWRWNSSPLATSWEELSR